MVEAVKELEKELTKQMQHKFNIDEQLANKFAKLIIKQLDDL